MAIQMATDLTYFELTIQEQRAGSILTLDQIHCIQNKLSMAALGKLNIEDDPLNPLAGAIARATADGEIRAYRGMINESQEAVTESYNEAKEAAMLETQKQYTRNAYEAFNIAAGIKKVVVPEVQTDTPAPDVVTSLETKS